MSGLRPSAILAAVRWVRRRLSTESPAQPNVPAPLRARLARVPVEEVPLAARFLPLADVAEILNVSAAQAYALVRTGELPAIKVGGRGQWRVETTELENYIQRKYAETRAMVEARPHDETVEVPSDGLL